MQFTLVKAVVAGLWLLAVGVLGALIPANNTKDWVMIVGLGIMPAVFMLRAWRQPVQTLSESIQEQIHK